MSDNADELTAAVEARAAEFFERVGRPRPVRPWAPNGLRVARGYEDGPPGVMDCLFGAGAPGHIRPMFEIMIQEHRERCGHCDDTASWPVPFTDNALGIDDHIDGHTRRAAP